MAARLRKAGHEVHTPTLTCLGGRAHLIGPEIGLRTHVDDLLGLLRYEDLWDVVLVGHSVGVTEPDQVAWLESELTPQPLPTCSQPTRLSGAVDAISCRAVLCTPTPRPSGSIPSGPETAPDPAPRRSPAAVRRGRCRPRGSRSAPRCCCQRSGTRSRWLTGGRLAAWLNAYVGAGAQHLIIRLAADGHHATLDKFDARVLPLLDV